MLVRLFFVLASVALGAEIAPPPFWKAKEKYFERVRDGEVLVAVRSVPRANAKLKNTLSLAGGGHVRAPAPYVFATAVDFEKIARLTGYIESAKWTAEKNLLSLEISAYGYKSSMDLTLGVHADSDPKAVSFEVIKGPLQGLTARLHFLELSSAKTEIGMSGEYSYDQFPIPKFFLEFGMEVVFQKMAVRLRSYVEEQFAKKERS